jgi:hypothetical protein
MLTKQDLSEIQKIIQQETSVIVEKAINPIKKDIKTIKSDISQIRSDIKTVINFFDKEYLELRKRVERIEEHLNLPPASN